MTANSAYVLAGMSQGLKIWVGELYVGPKIWGGASSKGGAKIGGGGGRPPASLLPTCLS